MVNVLTLLYFTVLGMTLLHTASMLCLLCRLSTHREGDLRSLTDVADVQDVVRTARESDARVWGTIIMLSHTVLPPACGGRSLMHCYLALQTCPGTARVGSNDGTSSIAFRPGTLLL
ncbi:hypothetical protein K431DRAFT_89597 [Polychaeton citri CBS 116435]|uniref:Uncharacterized protein n=1 Tax=Polychaeton citri CBS 116435 TaxID=1314669 RepID=A0A9P4UNC4_9PEZI|nr:hypothetical protein K431DRAFT_89597 [Polychaeton citri CBS 116435]